MKKITLGLAALMLCSAATAEPAKRPTSTGDVFLSAAPDKAIAGANWRVDFVPLKQPPPSAARLFVYREGIAAPVQVLSVGVHVPLRQVELSMPDLDDDGNPDIVISSLLDRGYRRQADAVFLWSAARGQFIGSAELSRLGSVGPAGADMPGCVFIESWCAGDGVYVSWRCLQRETGRWPKLKHPNEGCEDRD